jgi:hypothetical protein
MGCAEKLLMQIEALDDTTDGQIALIAICRKFELSQPIAAKEVGLVEVERWFNGYWDVRRFPSMLGFPVRAYRA